MIFSLAKVNDVKEIMEIINEAKEYLKENKIDQWQDGYPNEKTILSDIENNCGFVLVHDHQVIAYFVLDFRVEKTYNQIYEGSWLNNNNYATIHRICVRNNMKGQKVANDIIVFCKNYCKNYLIHDIRIDTHEDNLSMQRMLAKNEFTYCGIIYVRNNAKRLAYQCQF